jgi:hypothetical protein
MTLGHPLRRLLRACRALAPLLALAASAGCSGGGSGSANSIQTAVQDLAADPEGRTTVITFASTRGLAAAGVADFEGNAGQAAANVSVAGKIVTVEWDERVSPSHQVRAVGLSGVSSAFHAVATSDASVPTFAIQSATQNAGLGSDTITIAFAGPHVVESEAEDPARWALSTDGVALDLGGSVFDLDTATQTLSIALGPFANLHASFAIAATNLHSVADVLLSATPVPGNATGDATPPSLVSAEQNLAEDEYGRVVDFTFDEAMDPVTSLALSHFGATLPDVATTVEQWAENTLASRSTTRWSPGTTR